MKRSGTPGMAIAVVQGGKIMYAKGFGVAEVGKPEVVDPDTVFQVASFSKSVSSTCISKLLTDKVVSWSDPVTKYLPSFTLSDPAVTKAVTATSSRTAVACRAWRWTTSKGSASTVTRPCRS